MIPLSHLMLLALLQFSLGLLGLLLRRAGMVVLVSALVMFNGVLLFLTVRAAGGPVAGGGSAAGSQAAGVVVLALVVSLALTGASILYAFHRFSRTVGVDEHDRMKH